MDGPPIDLDLPPSLSNDRRDVLRDVARRNDATHGSDFLGLVLSGSVGRGVATDRSDVDVYVVLTDDGRRGRTTARSATVDEIPVALSELEEVPPFGSEWWWYRWSFAWAPVLLDRTAGRVRPYHKYLPWEVREHPLPGWEADDLLRLLSATLDGEPSAIRETFARVEAACAAFDSARPEPVLVPVIEGWEDELALFRG